MSSMSTTSPSSFTVDAVMVDVRQRTIDRTLLIPTGIAPIDNGGGLRRKELSGILGYTGQGKTTLARTLAYNAAMHGSRVLYIPLETTFDEELAAFQRLHSHDDWGPGYSSYAETVGRDLTIVMPKETRLWKDIRAAIQAEDAIRPLDLVVIDSLLLVNPDPTIEDRPRAKLAMAADARQMAHSHNYSIVTPILGNRRGFEDAEERDGVWDLRGISRHEGLEAILDNCFYVFATPEMVSMGVLKVGACKQHLDSSIPGVQLRVDFASRMVMPGFESVVQLTEAKAKKFFEFE